MEDSEQGSQEHGVILKKGQGGWKDGFPAAWADTVSAGLSYLPILCHPKTECMAALKLNQKSAWCERTSGIWTPQPHVCYLLAPLWRGFTSDNNDPMAVVLALWSKDRKITCLVWNLWAK